MALIGKRQQLLTFVKTTADKFKIDANLLDAIIVVESAYNPWAVRYEPNYNHVAIPDTFAKNNRISVQTERQCQKMSWGLAQLMGGTARFLSYGGPLTQLLDPETNIICSAKYILKLMVEFPYLDDQIAAYNAGSPKKKSTGSGTEYVNQDYVSKVMRTMETLRLG